MYSPMDTWGFPCEFPHSEIFGSQAMCAYPKLIAAYHVLHRLLMPRHSPCALCSLTYCHDISFKTKLQRIFLGYVVLTYLYNYVQFSKNILSVINAYYVVDFVAPYPHVHLCTFQYSLLIS